MMADYQAPPPPPPPPPGGEDELVAIPRLAERTGVTPRVLRYWEELGLISPTREHGKLRYSPRDTAIARLTKRLVDSGVSLDGLQMLKQLAEREVRGAGQDRGGAALTELALRIREHALAWAVAEIDASRIDAWNIYQASRQAMVAAVEGIRPTPDYLLVDAMELPLPLEQKSLIHGDARSVSIAAASILAKVERDRLMDEFDQMYPQYGLGSNRGYSTPDHLEALRRYGPTPLHRFSYAPVREATCWAAHATQEALPLAQTSIAPTTPQDSGNSSPAAPLSAAAGE